MAYIRFLYWTFPVQSLTIRNFFSITHYHNSHA